MALLFKVLPLYLTNRKQRTPERPIGPFTTERATYQVAPGSGLRVTWFGHSSMLLEIDGFRLLVDPVWEQRASPLSWSGPKRFFPPTTALNDLPEIDVVLVSHDHYDHLGESTVRALARQENTKEALWITSLGVAPLLHRWGVASERTVEMDWTESQTILRRGRTLKVTSWPARHFSGRSISNRFETLWASFAIEGDRHSVFYGADSGPWPGFAEIGSTHRCFDLIMLEIGAYDALWADIHLGPVGATEAYKAMNAGGLLMPIHWGLFDLALHGWTEPIEELIELSEKQGLPLWCPEPGLPTEVVQGQVLLTPWWREPRTGGV